MKTIKALALQPGDRFRLLGETHFYSFLGARDTRTVRFVDVGKNDVAVTTQQCGETYTLPAKQEVEILEETMA